MDKKQILVVEDERVVAEDIKNSLQDIGYDVTAVVSSGEDAIKKAVEDKPDLVLLDIKLKGDMDGIAVANKIRSQTHIPVVYLTAHADEITLERAKLTEPYGYILKPFENKDLQITIEMALNNWRTKKRVKEDEKWFSWALWSVSAALIAIDRKGFISFMTPAAESLTGWNLEDVAGKTIMRVFNATADDVGKEIEDPVIKEIQNGRLEESINDMVLTTKDGTRRHVERSCSPIKNDQGSIIGTVMVFRDITEQKETERELIGYIDNLEKELKRRSGELVQSEKMASLGFLVAGVAHEINDPLAYVKSNTEFIRDGILDLREYCLKNTGLDKVEQYKKLINKNLEGIERIVTMTKTIQKFTKPDSGSKIPADINRGIEDTLHILKSELRDQIKVNKNLERLPKIVCNIEQLNQVFLTLILNASYSMDEGEIWVKTWGDSDFVNIEIEDNGRGISEKDMEKIYDPLSNIQDRGTGLSLSLCYRIIKEHKGEFEIDSRLGKGTKMTIKLPI